MGSVAGGHGADEGDDDKPVKKKTRKSTTKTKGKGKVPKEAEGKLAKLLELPVDILTEVASHLDPLSLLYLSRTSKSFHHLLASRSSAWIWRIVRQSVELPDLQADDLSEMQYASLVFENSCTICRKSPVTMTSFELRKKYCKTCEAQHLGPLSTLISTTTCSGGSVHRYPADVCLRKMVSTYFSLYSQPGLYHLPEASALNDQLNTLQAAAGSPGETSICDGRLTRHQICEAEKQVETEFASEEKQLKEFVKRRYNWVAAVKRDADVLENWTARRSMDYEDITLSEEEL